MTTSAPLPSTGSSRPFGNGLRDMDLRLMVASTDVRFRQKLQAVIVRRPPPAERTEASFAVELLVLSTMANIAVLQEEAHMLDSAGRLQKLVDGDLSDVVLESTSTGERVMVTAVKPEDYSRIEALGVLEQIHIGTSGEDRGSWVCRLIDAGRLDALFGGTVIDIRG